MKKTIILLAAICSFGCSCAYGQTKDSVLYAFAYEYIKNDSLGRAYRIIQSKTLIKTFYNLLEDKEIDQCNIDSLKTLSMTDINRVHPTIRESSTDREIRRLAFQYKLRAFDLQSVRDKGDTLSYVFPPIMNPLGETNFFLRFSKVFNNEFFVELDNGMWPMGMSYVYYFRFDDDKNLKYVNRFLIES